MNGERKYAKRLEALEAKIDLLTKVVGKLIRPEKLPLTSLPKSKEGRIRHFKIMKYPRAVQLAEEMFADGRTLEEISTAIQQQLNIRIPRSSLGNYRRAVMMARFDWY